MDKDTFYKFLFQRQEEMEWYLQDDFEAPEIESTEIVRLASGLFLDIERIVDVFSEKQVCMGLNYLINASCGSWCYSFLDEVVPSGERVAAISNMFNVFDKGFARHCKHLSHLALPDEFESLGFSYACYMWWDVFPRHGIPNTQDLENVDTAILGTLERILTIDNMACKESAIHGLGHWHSAKPVIVETILAKNSFWIPSALADYAMNASNGNVQ